MEERSLAKSLADEEGRMFMARIRAFTLPWESQETTSEGDCKQLGPAVYHSTGFLQSHNSHKRFLKMSRDHRCPFSWKHEFRTNCFQSHNSHKRVPKMWQLCPFPRIVSYWLLRSQGSHQKPLKMLHSGWYFMEHH